MWKNIIQEIIINTDNLENIKDILADNLDFKDAIPEDLDSMGGKELNKLINNIK